MTFRKISRFWSKQILFKIILPIFALEEIFGVTIMILNF